MHTYGTVYFSLMLLPRFYPKKREGFLQQIQFPFVQKAKTIWFSLTTEPDKLFGEKKNKKKHIVQILDLFSWNQCFHFQFLHFGRSDLNDPIWGQNQPFRAMWLQSTPHLERFLVKYFSFLVFSHQYEWGNDFNFNYHQLTAFILFSFFSLPELCIAPSEFSDAIPDNTCMVDIEGRGFYLISIGPIILLDLDPIEYWSFLCQQ